MLISIKHIDNVLTPRYNLTVALKKSLITKKKYLVYLMHHLFE